MKLCSDEMGSTLETKEKLPFSKTSRLFQPYAITPTRSLSPEIRIEMLSITRLTQGIQMRLEMRC